MSEYVKMTSDPVNMFGTYGTGQANFAPMLDPVGSVYKEATGSDKMSRFADPYNLYSNRGYRESDEESLEVKPATIQNKAAQIDQSESKKKQKNLFAGGYNASVLYNRGTKYESS